MGAHAEQYSTRRGIHPSEPNYLWLEAGTNFGIHDDNDPSVNHQGTTQHLTTLLDQRRRLLEDVPGGHRRHELPADDEWALRPQAQPLRLLRRHDRHELTPHSANCIAHVRPYPELATDLANNTIARYNFITPEPLRRHARQHGCATSTTPIKQGDTWLVAERPADPGLGGVQERRRALHHLGRGRGQRRADRLDRALAARQAGLRQHDRLHPQLDAAHAAGDLRGDPLAGRRGEPDRSARPIHRTRPRRASTASPAQVPFGQNTTTLTFATGGRLRGHRLRRRQRRRRSCPSRAARRGTPPATFINSGVYVFTLHAGGTCAGAALATTTVTKLNPKGDDRPRHPRRPRHPLLRHERHDCHKPGALRARSPSTRGTARSGR